MLSFGEKKKRSSGKLLRKRLKSDAVPSFFKDLPSYYTNPDAPERSGLSLASSRLENENHILEEHVNAFLQADKVKNYEDMISKLSSEAIPDGYLFHYSDVGLNLLHLSSEQPPNILATVSISKTLGITVYKDRQLISPSSYSHIPSSSLVSCLSQITNLMAFAKSMERSTPNVSKQFIASIKHLVEEYLSTAESNAEASLLKFLTEQVELVFTNSNQRHYSVELLLMSYNIYSTSAKAYIRLLEEKVIILPSVRALQKITMKLNSNRSGLSDSQYLHMRFSKLNTFERNVLLMIDEIYLSKRVEATGGQIFGLTEGCEVAGTALCFMIKSLSSGYKDMVGMYPISKLRAETQKACYDRVG